MGAELGLTIPDAEYLWYLRRQLCVFLALTQADLGVDTVRIHLLCRVATEKAVLHGCIVNRISDMDAFLLLT